MVVAPLEEQVSRLAMLAQVTTPCLAPSLLLVVVAVAVTKGKPVETAVLVAVVVSVNLAPAVQAVVETRRAYLRLKATMAALAAKERRAAPVTMKAAVAAAVLVPLAVTSADMPEVTAVTAPPQAFRVAAQLTLVVVAVQAVMAAPAVLVEQAAVVAAIPAERTAPQTRVVALVRLRLAAPASS